MDTELLLEPLPADARQPNQPTAEQHQSAGDGDGGYIDVVQDEVVEVIPKSHAQRGR